MSKETVKLKKQLRGAIADYMSSEGCGCCRGDAHGEHERKIAELLSVPKYPDGYGYNFSKYKTKK